MGSGPRGSYSSSVFSRRPTGQPNEQRQDTYHSKKSVDDSYKKYVDKNEITELQGKTIDKRREAIVKILKKDHAIEESHLIGSFTRGTMVGPLRRESDADVMIVLDANEHGNWVNQKNGAKNCLQSIKRKLENDPRFANTEIKIDRNVVAVKYKDSTIEIVPAFYYKDAPGAENPSDNPYSNTPRDGYAIPDTHNNSWVGTNPRKYKRMFKARDQANDGKVARLTKIMKKWREEKNVPVESYHMEIMVYNYFEEKARTGRRVPNSDSEMVHDFVDTLPQRIKGKTREPVYNETVDKNMTSKQKSAAYRKAVIARKQIKDSKRLQEKGDTEAAKEKLKGTFGSNYN